MVNGPTYVKLGKHGACLVETPAASIMIRPEGGGHIIEASARGSNIVGYFYRFLAQAIDVMIGPRVEAGSHGEDFDGGDQPYIFELEGSGI